MKRNVIAVLFFLVSLMAASCSKMDQLFNNGEPVTERREVAHRFSAISMYNNVNVKLMQSNYPHLELTCPKNLIEKVTTEIEGDTLVIKNENEYNWLRSFDYSIDLTVYYDSLRQINFASALTSLCITTACDRSTSPRWATCSVPTPSKVLPSRPSIRLEASLTPSRFTTSTLISTKAAVTST